MNLQSSGYCPLDSSLCTIRLSHRKERRVLTGKFKLVSSRIRFVLQEKIAKKITSWHNDLFKCKLIRFALQKFTNKQCDGICTVASGWSGEGFLCSKLQNLKI